MREVKRVVVVGVYGDPCRNPRVLEDLSLTLFYSLIVSHGIRIDTILVTLFGDKIVVLDGRRLKHLYPQKKSLEGFVKAVYCKEKQLAGTLISYTNINNVIRPILNSCSKVLLMDVLTGKSGRSSYKTISNIVDFLSKRNRDVDCIVVSVEGVGGILRLKFAGKIILETNMSRIPEAIAVAHYVLDIAYGALLRRRGEVVYAENYL